jgi:hypothetical protein
MIQLGDLTSQGGAGDFPSNKSNSIHPLVTVFLFGEALGVIQRHKRFLQKGWVCAILSPNLMPSRDDTGSSAAAVSLSVNDPRQVLLIGRSVDCSNCKGTIRKKVASDFGIKWEDVGCSTLIDLRGGSSYCLTHRRQGLSSRSTNANANSTSDSRLQKLRADNARNGVTHASTFNNQKPNHLAQSSIPPSITLSEALSKPGFLDETLPAATSAMTAQYMKKAPKHMKKVTSANEAKVVNPYAKSKPTEQLAAKRTVHDVLGEELNRKKGRLNSHFSNSKNTSTAKQPNAKCKVFQAEGYDGSVQVPKPSSLFQKSTFSASLCSVSSSANGKSATSDILEKQRSLAELLQQKKQGIVNSKTEDLLSRLSSRRIVQPTSVQYGHQSLRNNFATSFGDFSSDGFGTNTLDRDYLMSAKSCFVSAANAQEYARARGAVQELEMKEFEIDKRKKRIEGSGVNKNSGKLSETTIKAAGIVTAGWICRTCKKKTTFKPVGCFRVRHDVQQQRELKNRNTSLGSTKERLQRHGQDSAVGGLTLGSGLEWSGWRGGIN